MIFLLLFSLMESPVIYAGLHDGRSCIKKVCIKKVILKYSFFLIHAPKSKRKLYILASDMQSCTIAVFITLSRLTVIFQIGAVEGLPKIHVLYVNTHNHKHRGR